MQHIKTRCKIRTLFRDILLLCAHEQNLYQAHRLKTEYNLLTHQCLFISVIYLT